MLKMLKKLKSMGLLFREFFVFMRVRKKWWLAPLIFILIILGVLIIFAEGSALAPFIYALF